MWGTCSKLYTGTATNYGGPTCLSEQQSMDTTKGQIP